MLLGCIGDDFTGSSDLANTLAKQGMRTVQYSGVPSSDAATNVEAGVIALKSRSIAVEEAVKQSLDALAWLKAQGCKQFFFKYCSTFDSTPEGNIGPVADALADELGAKCVIVCPAFPGAGRTVYQGHLFVNDVLLSESGMQNHPLTPMTDSDIRRWLRPQTKYSVGHVAAPDVLAGVDVLTASLNNQVGNGYKHIVVDALQDADLMTIGQAAKDFLLITGGSGVSLGLPANFRSRGEIAESKHSWEGENGQCVVLSGSCSRMTRSQLEAHRQANNPTFEIKVDEVMSGNISPGYICQWLMGQEGIPVAYSSADPDVVEDIQKKFGRETSAEVLEDFFAVIARQLVALGLKKLIVAGGETSGAVVEALNIQSMEMGPEIDTGVPAMRASKDFVLALKSGNFGSVDFFERAARVLEGDTLEGNILEGSNLS